MRKAFDERQEKKRNEAQETQSLRKLMSLYTPERKDEFTAMNLADLRGEAEGIAVKSALQKQQQEQQQAAQETQSTAAMARVLQDAGSLNETEVLAQGNGPVRATRQPVAMTPQRLQTVLARNPQAIANRDFAPNMQALRALIGDATAEDRGGLEFVTTPTGAIVTREKKTGAFQYDPFSKAEATQNRTQFSVKPIMDKFGRSAGYGVEAQFGSEDEAKAWADKQNQTFGGNTKDLDEATAKALLKEAGGDKVKARALAKERGYTLK